MKIPQIDCTTVTQTKATSNKSTTSTQNIRKQMDLISNGGNIVLILTFKATNACVLSTKAYVPGMAIHHMLVDRDQHYKINVIGIDGYI